MRGSPPPSPSDGSRFRATAVGGEERRSDGGQRANASGNARRENEVTNGQYRSPFRQKMPQRVQSKLLIGSCEKLMFWFKTLNLCCTLSSISWVSFLNFVSCAILPNPFVRNLVPFPYCPFPLLSRKGQCAIGARVATWRSNHAETEGNCTGVCGAVRGQD